MQDVCSLTRMTTQSTTQTAAEMFAVLTPYTLATIADVVSPDSTTSPGALYLLGLAENLAERLDYRKESDELWPSVDDVSDVIAEVVDPDSAAPYTANRWAIFTDLCGWLVDISDYSPVVNRDGEPADLNDLCAVVLYIIGDTLCRALVESLEDY